jgi:hypothetical protein
LGSAARSSVGSLGHPRLLFDSAGREAIRAKLATDPIQSSWLRRFTQSLRSSLYKDRVLGEHKDAVGMALQTAAAFTFTGNGSYCDSAREYVSHLLPSHNDYMCTALDTGAGLRLVVPFVVDWCAEVWAENNASFLDWTQRNLYWQNYGYVEPKTVGGCGGVGRGAPHCPYQCQVASPPAFVDPCDISHIVEDIWPPLLLNYFVVDGFESNVPPGNDTASVLAAAFGPDYYLDFYNLSMLATIPNGVKCPWNPHNTTPDLPAICPRQPWGTNLIQWMFRQLGAPGETPSGVGMDAAGLDRQVTAWADWGPLSIAGSRLLNINTTDQVPALSKSAVFPLLAAIGQAWRPDFNDNPLPAKEEMRGRPWVRSQAYALLFGPPAWQGAVKRLFRRRFNSSAADLFDCSQPMPRIQDGGSRKYFGPSCNTSACPYSTIDGPCYGCDPDPSKLRCEFADIWTMLFFPTDDEVREADPASTIGHGLWDERMGSLFLRSNFTQNFSQDLALQTMCPTQDYFGIAQRTLAKDDPVTFFGSHPPDVNTFRFAGLGGVWARNGPVLGTGDTRGSHNAGYWAGNNTLLFVNASHMPFRQLGDCPKGNFVRDAVINGAVAHTATHGSCTDVLNHTRRVLGDFSGLGGTEGLVVVADSSNNGGLWRMVSDLSNNVTIINRSDFSISAGGALLQGKVLWPTNANITSAEVCTYNHRAKPPQQCAPTVDVLGSGEFLIVMTVDAHGQQPAVVNSISGDGCCNKHKFSVGEGRMITVEGNNFILA